MAHERDPFARRNRVRIVGLVLLAIVNYWLAACAAATATLMVLVLWFASEGGVDSLDGLKVVGLLLVGAFVLGVPIGSVVALVRLPRERGRLERRVLDETKASVVGIDSHHQVANLLAGLAIAADVPPPTFAIIDDPAPNSFSLGTKPAETMVAVTTGLIVDLTRDELEAVLAYEISRIRSWDVALSSWTVALTASSLDMLTDDDARAIVGWLPMRFAQWLQVWALRGQGLERDRAAVRFTRNPAALVRALEKLHADTSEVRLVSRATAPLWIEVPLRVFGTSTRSSQRLRRELLLDERIGALRTLAGTVPSG